MSGHQQSNKISEECPGMLQPFEVDPGSLGWDIVTVLSKSLLH